MTPSAWLTVERASADDVRQRQIVVSLDARRLPRCSAAIAQRATSRRAAIGGAHNTPVWRTLEFDMAARSAAAVTAVNRAGPGTAALIALLGVWPRYLTLAPADAGVPRRTRGMFAAGHWSAILSTVTRRLRACAPHTED